MQSHCRLGFTGTKSDILCQCNLGFHIVQHVQTVVPLLPLLNCLTTISVILTSESELQAYACRTTLKFTPLPWYQTSKLQLVTGKPPCPSRGYQVLNLFTNNRA